MLEVSSGHKKLAGCAQNVGAECARSAKQTQKSFRMMKVGRKSFVLSVRVTEKDKVRG